MAEFDESINQKKSILLSRNMPVALVVGAAGFLGSFICEKLLEKDIQVIGIDNLEGSGKENLEQAAANKHFHLLLGKLSELDLELSRLDYLIVAEAEEIKSVLPLLKKYRCRILLVSSIDLYDKSIRGDVNEKLKKAETVLAGFTGDFNLNARVLRLGSVFGPRMTFDGIDPIKKLIKETLCGNLQKEIPMEFSTRALYVADAAELILKTIFAGSTAQKIFDGVNPVPVKISEIKQVLLDPVWYENRDFEFAQLPPWPTPNLEKTTRFLNWKPRTKLLNALKETLAYFRDNEIVIVEAETKEKDEPNLQIEEDKKIELEALKESREEPQKKPKPKKVRTWPKFPFALTKIYFAALVVLIGYAIIWPAVVFGWDIWTMRLNLNEGFENLEKGDFDKSIENIRQANKAVISMEGIFENLEPLGKSGLLEGQLRMGNQFIALSNLMISSSENAISGVQKLLLGLKAATGELIGDPLKYFESAKAELDAASNSSAQASALLKSPEIREALESFLFSEIAGFESKLEIYQKLINKAQVLSALLPELTASGGTKNYLILLQNNMELRPGGGFIGSYGKISLEGGKLKKMEVNDVYAVDGALALEVEPPQEIKSDLGQKRWYLRDSNWEPDFPTSARQAEWFYEKETGEKVDGVIAFDVSAMEKLLEVIGPLDLAGYDEKITSENLFEKAVSYAETGFFPGSQAKKSFLTALANEVFNKIFFLPGNNWPAILSGIGKSLEEKHISVYLNNPKLFSYADSEGWTQVLPRGTKENQKDDFLSIVEANLGANKSNYYLDRNLNLETVIGKDGEVKHRLRISYTNRSPSGAFPGGEYKNRMRIYLPYGSKAVRALWGEADRTADLSAFVDWGRSGYSILLTLGPKEQKTFVLDYEVPVKVNFEEGKGGYRLDVIKQAGILKDPFKWTITYPISFRVVSQETEKLGPQEQIISTDLSKDRSFTVQFEK